MDKKDPSAWSLRGLLGRNVRSMSVIYENTLELKDLSDASDEHQLPIVFWIVSVSLNKLKDCTTHQVGFIDLIGVTNNLQYCPSGSFPFASFLPSAFLA